MSKDKDEPAFSLTRTEVLDNGFRGTVTYSEVTIWDYYAAAALQGVISDTKVKLSSREAASAAAVMADTMLKERYIRKRFQKERQ